ncbi:MAG: hypothetical protein EBY96_06680 [Actinobacteria bacterium]|nr:hypothetical protein [Actinomycetota bacterium]
MRQAQHVVVLLIQPDDDCTARLRVEKGRTLNVPPAGGLLAITQSQ